MHGFSPKSHYRFWEATALAWIDTDHHWTSRNKRMKRNQVTKTPNKVNNKSGSISFLSLMTQSSTVLLFRLCHPVRH